MRAQFVFTLILGACLSGAALAHSGGGDDAPAKGRMNAGGAVHGNDGGHAAALGRPADPAQATRTIQVRMHDTMRFSPGRISVRRGETVRFVVRNEGRLKHEMVLGTSKELQEHAALMRRFPEMEHDDPNAVSVEPGQTGEFAWTFSRGGRFDFACLIPGHFEAGMKGDIVVQR